MKPLILMDFKSKRLFCVLRPLVQLHSRLDKAAKSMRKEDAPMSNCKVIALTNQKGGVGKTTTAVNLGVSLAQQGKKVLLIDADAQANLTMSLGYNRPDDLPVTLSTIMQDIIEDNPIDVQKSILHHGEGVDLLPSNIELSGLEVRLINAISRESVLKTCISEVRKNYDYVLVDCMPSLGMLTINALAAADSVVIPTQPHYLSAKGLELLLRSVSKVRRQINPPLRIDGILMTMVMPRTNISKEITATVRSAYGQKIKVFDTQIPHSIRAVELYRFDYRANGYSNKAHLVGIVNAVLGTMAILFIAVMLYIKFAILAPFERLSSIPYELSKGNLTAPMKETKNRYFGKFLWGIDILRENIEQQKQRELEMQKEKKTLLLSLSHDIKTPLSAIKLYSAALSKNLYSDAEKQHKIAENINEKADEIEGYVSQIITASREDFFSLEVNMGEFYLSELVEKIAGYYKEKLALIKTDFIIGKYKNCLLSGDLSRSVEVMQNIIENALKYGDGRRVELIFPKDDECVQIAIMNGGCTLEKDDLPHIFESFWRGANAGNIGGNGLGLYICRQLMRKMNGEIFAKIDNDIITVTTVFARA